MRDFLRCGFHKDMAWQTNGQAKSRSGSILALLTNAKSEFLLLSVFVSREGRGCVRRNGGSTIIGCAHRVDKSMIVHALLHSKQSEQKQISTHTHTHAHRHHDSTKTLKTIYMMLQRHQFAAIKKMTFDTMPQVYHISLSHQDVSHNPGRESKRRERRDAPGYKRTQAVFRWISTLFWFSALSLRHLEQ